VIMPGVLVSSRLASVMMREAGGRRVAEHDHGSAIDRSEHVTGGYERPQQHHDQHEPGALPGAASRADVRLPWHEAFDSERLCRSGARAAVPAAAGGESTVSSQRLLQADVGFDQRAWWAQVTWVFQSA
jgi:hypothetical protein